MHYILFRLYFSALVTKPSKNSKVKIFTVNLESSFPLDFPLCVYPDTFITGMLHFSADIQALEYLSLWNQWLIQHHLCLLQQALTTCFTLCHDIFMVIKFYSLPLNNLDEKCTDLNFIEARFHTQRHGDIL